MKSPTKALQAVGIGKGTVLTLGSVAMIAGLLIAGWQFHGWMAGIAAAEVTRHVDKDVDAAHPSIEKRYVSQQALNGKIHRIDKTVTTIQIKQAGIEKKLDGIEISQREILRRLTVRRYRPRSSNNGN